MMDYRKKTVVASVAGLTLDGMFAGYGALISSFYSVDIRSTATNTIFNFGRAVGGLSPILVGYLLQSYSMMMAMIYLAVLYCISFVVMLTLKTTQTSHHSTEEMQPVQNIS